MTARPKCEECGIPLQARDAVAEVGALQYANRKVYHLHCFTKVVSTQRPGSSEAEFLKALMSIDGSGRK